MVRRAVLQALHNRLNRHPLPPDDHRHGEGQHLAPSRESGWRGGSKHEDAVAQDGGECTRWSSVPSVGSARTRPNPGLTCTGPGGRVEECSTCADRYGPPTIAVPTPVACVAHDFGTRRGWQRRAATAPTVPQRAVQRIRNALDPSRLGRGTTGRHWSGPSGRTASGPDSPDCSFAPHTTRSSPRRARPDDPGQSVPPRPPVTKDRDAPT